MSSDATVYQVGGEYLIRPTQSGIDKIKNYFAQNPQLADLGIKINLATPTPLPLQNTYTWKNAEDPLHYQRIAGRSLVAAAAFARERAVINK
jgi:hypothetical protein